MISRSSSRATKPFLVAIVGGSGAGKSWVAERLQRALRHRAARISLDDFYRDRSHLAPARRAGLNFDNPDAIDWDCFEKVLRAVGAGRRARLPAYDFAIHCRLARTQVLEPKPILLVDGLWLLGRRSVRNLFGLRIFLATPRTIRLARRLERDLLTRGRTRQSVLHQFRTTVEPMHRKWVEPQKRWADLVLHDSNSTEVRRLAALILELRNR